MGVNRNILNLAVPSILANITVPLVGMADIAVAGHLDAGNAVSSATLIGGVAIGTMLFDLLYWNFGFLRVGTGGLTAQAFGRGDRKDSASILTRAAGIAVACSLLLLAVQWIFLKAAFAVVDCTPEVEKLASDYFFIRIWASPATLTLMSFKGWFIGMQDSISPMVTDLVVNIVNVAASVVLALGLDMWDFHYDGIGFPGIAAGTVIAQYSGLLCAAVILAVKYWKKVFGGFTFNDIVMSFKGAEMKRFFVMNTDLFVRSLCFIGIYIGFTTFSAHYGDLLLASSAILMKIMMLFSYFTDGFAYAGEALTGKNIGARNTTELRQTVRHLFGWGIGLSVAFTLLYAIGGKGFLGLLTNDTTVIEASGAYFYWVLAIPLAGFTAFLLDGICIGATATGLMLRSMAVASVSFFALYFGFEHTGGNHALWLAFIVYLALRGILQAVWGLHLLTGTGIR